MIALPQDIILIDTETTGKSTRAGNEAIQIGAVRLRYGTLEEVASYTSRIRPRRPENWAKEAERVHGIKLEDLSDAPEAEEVAKGFLDAMYTPEERERRPEAAMLAAHNARFDWDFFSLLMEDGGFNGDVCGYHILDTWTMAATSPACQEITNRKSFSLQRLADHFGIQRSEQHDALEDVRVTAEVMRCIRARENELKSNDIEDARATAQAREIIGTGEPKLIAATPTKDTSESVEDIVLLHGGTERTQEEKQRSVRLAGIRARRSL